MFRKSFSIPLGIIAFLLIALSSVHQTGAAPTKAWEDFDSGFTLTQTVGAHADWYDGSSGPVVTGGSGVAGSVGLAPAINIFTWTAHPFSWNATEFREVIFQMDYQTDSNAKFYDDRIGWMTTDSNVDSTNFFGVQLDNLQNDGIVTCWRNASGTLIQTPIVSLTGIKANTWYRFLAKITKKTATSARINVSLVELDAIGNPTGTPITGTVSDTSLWPDGTPNTNYFTAAALWPAYKNSSGIQGSADNAFFATIERFSFVVTTDWHTSSAQTTVENNLQQVNSWIISPTPDMPAPAFMVITGDFPYVSQTEASIDTVLGSGFLWYPVVGNHEISDDINNFNYIRDAIVPSLPYIVNYGPTGSTNTSYSWDYSNAHFIAVNEYWDGTTNTNADHLADGDIRPQLRTWIDTDLADSSVPHRFVFVHEPAYPDTRHLGDSLDKYPANRDAFIETLNSNQVETLFCGHTHYYEHDIAPEYPLGNLHQVTNGALQGDPYRATITYVLVDGASVTYKVYYRANNSTPFALNEQWTIGEDTTVPTVTINQAVGQADPISASPINFTVVFSEPVTGFSSSSVTISGTAGGTKTVMVTGGPITYNVAVSGMTSSGTVIATIAAGVAQDTAGNWNAASTSTDNSVTYDTTVPTVTGVTSNTANGTYRVGTVIDVRVTFSVAVNVTGTPRLRLETGTTDRNATYASGSGSTTLVLNYTVQTGDASNDLDYVATSSLTLNGGTIKDAAGNNATLTLPSPGAAGSLSANKNIAVDGVVPRVTGATSNTANGTYGVGTVIDVRVTFSETVNVTGTPRLRLETGTTDRYATYASGSGSNTLVFNYTVQAGDTSSDLNYVATSSLTLNAGTIKDGAGNNATLTLPSPGAAGSLGYNKNIVIDGVVPRVTGATSNTANGTYGVETVIDVRVTFSETVNVTGTPQLLLETGTTDRNATYASGSGSNTLVFNYTVQTGDTSNDLDYVATSSLTLNGGTIKDAPGNNATLTLPSPGAAGSLGYNKNIVISTAAPTIAVNDFANYRVFQRDIGGTSKSVTISGTYSNMNWNRVEARVLQHGTNTAVVDWTTIDPTPGGGTFSGNLTVPQGGWYNIEVQALDSAGSVIGSSRGTNKWGVGMIILCIGQSNMSGHGQSPLTNVTSDLAVNYSNAGRWEHLADPYDDESPAGAVDNDNSTAGGSMIPALANSLLQTFNFPIVYVPSAKDGSNLYSQWAYRNPSNHYDTTTLYGQSITKAQSVGGVELIIMHQGEADTNAHRTEAQYEADFATMISHYREDLYATIPIFICQLGTISIEGGDPRTDADVVAVRNAQHDLDNGIDIFMAATAMDQSRIDDVHYTTKSLNAIGEHIAQTIKYYLGAASYYRGPAITSAFFVDGNRDTVDVQIDHSGGNDITPVSGITGFSLRSDGSPVSITSVDRISADRIRLTLASAIPGGTTVKLQYLWGSNPDTSGLVRDNSSLALPLENTTADITVTDSQLPDLAIAKTHTGNFAQGQTGATYTITVTNNGSAPTSGTITVTDALPSGLTATAISGSGWNCTLGTLTCTRSDELPAAASYPPTTLTVNVAGSAPGLLTNTATVSGGGDTSPANNMASDVTTVESTEPTVTINQAVGQADPTNVSPVNFTVVFSETVTGFSSSGVTISGTAGGTKTVTVTDGPITYNVAVSGMTLSGTVIVTIPAGAAQDSAGNWNIASTSTDNSVTYDTTVPTVTGVTSNTANGTYGVGTVIDVRVTFSETVSVTGTPQLLLETGTTDRNATYVSRSGSNTLVFNYTVQTGDMSNDLDYVATSSLTLNGGTIEDAVGNNAILTLPSPGAAGSLSANKNIIIATLTSISVSPVSASVAVNSTQQFTATTKDQFGNDLVPQPSISWTVSDGGTINSSGLFTAGSTAGGPYTVTAASGAVSGTASVTVTVASTFTIGETNIFSSNDNGNGNWLIAQQATLGQSAIILSMSFYVTTAGGNLRLGIYDAAGPNGGPGRLKAQTAAFAPISGWNTQNVVSQVSLPAGTYWLAFLPSSNSLGCKAASTGSAKGYSYSYQALPATFSTSPISGTIHWSFYATLQTVP
jgi:hypothetical protein